MQSAHDAGHEEQENQQIDELGNVIDRGTGLAFGIRFGQEGVDFVHVEELADKGANDGGDDEGQDEQEQSPDYGANPGGEERFERLKHFDSSKILF